MKYIKFFSIVAFLAMMVSCFHNGDIETLSVIYGGTVQLKDNKSAKIGIELEYVSGGAPDVVVNRINKEILTNTLGEDFAGNKDVCDAVTKKAAALESILE
ncbi:MAG: hypothetical protein IJ151_06205 [Bacteroidales bacterium]|nr:hypothetical protein [Bacteroidales bacterium]